MSLHFTVSGANIRVFLSVLLSVGKIGDGVYLVALKDGIELSAVTPSRDGHIAVRIHGRCFDSFAFEPATSAPDAAGVGESDGAPAELFLCVLAKTLMGTVLRQHSNSTLQSIEFSYDGATSNRTAAADTGDEGGDPHASSSDARARKTADLDERGDADMVRWRCVYTRGLTKTFLLRLAEGVPTSVCANAARYHFEACGDARTYGSLLASLPSSSGQCALTLLENGGLELRSVNSGGAAQQQQQPTQKQTARSARGSRDGGASVTASSVDGSTTVVTAFAKAFHLFRFFDVAPVPTSSTAVGDASLVAQPLDSQQMNPSRGGAEDVDGSSGPSMVPPTPSPTSQQQQQQQRRSAQSSIDPCTMAAPAAGPLLLVKPFVQLPGKVFDVKPFKQAAWLAEQLGVQLRLRFGEAGMPLILASITPEEVLQLAADAAIDVSTTATTMTRDGVRSGAGGVGARHAGVSAIPSAPSACVSFTVYVAALDMASPSADTEAAAAAAAASRTSGQEVGMATATSSTVNTPRASAHFNQHVPPPPPSSFPSVVPASTPNRSCEGDGTVEGDQAAASTPPYSFPSSANFVLASATRSSMNVGRSGSAGDKDASRGTSMVLPTPLHGQEDLPPAQPSPRASGGQASISVFGGNSSNSHTPSHVEASFASAMPSPGEGEATEYAGHTTRVGSGVLAAAAAPRPSSTSYAAASLNTMYPLDFEAFARTYTTHNDADAEEEEDAQDAELRDFLASCVASMSRDPTQN